MALLLLALRSAPTLAEADGPDFYRMTDAASAAIPLRTAPETEAMVLGTIPPGTDGLANFGCIGGLDAAAWAEATDEERSAAVADRWCRVGHERLIGWVPGQSVREGTGAGNFAGGDRLGALDETRWTVRSLDGVGIDDGLDGTIQFRAGQASGRAFCNRYFADYTFDRGALAMGPVAATRLACPTHPMTLETRLLNALEATRTAVPTDRILALFDSDDVLRVTLDRAN
jgi:heat shock protein HslJ